MKNAEYNLASNFITTLIALQRTEIQMDRISRKSFKTALKQSRKIQSGIKVTVLPLAAEFEDLEWENWAATHKGYVFEW